MSVRILPTDTYSRLETLKMCTYTLSQAVKNVIEIKSKI